MYICAFVRTETRRTTAYLFGAPRRLQSVIRRDEEDEPDRQIRGRRSRYLIRKLRGYKKDNISLEPFPSNCLKQSANKVCVSVILWHPI